MRPPTAAFRAAKSYKVPNKPSIRRAIILPRAQDDAATKTETETAAATNSMDEFPGCSRYSVSLSKPLGIVLEENKTTGTITVAEIVPGGSAEKDGTVGVGDILIATNGLVKTTSQTYGEVVVQGGEQIVRMPVRGEKFDTVLAAIGSIPGNQKVVLDFMRC